MGAFSRAVQCSRVRFHQRTRASNVLFVVGLSSVAGLCGLAALSGLTGCDHGPKAQHTVLEAPQDTKSAALSAGTTLTPAASMKLRLEPIDIHRDASPFAKLDRAALQSLVQRDPEALGSLSVGRPNRGHLVNAVHMSEGRLWKLAEPKLAWGTRETIAGIEEAIERVEADHPGSPALYVGHISRQNGGWLRPHRSHQSGRDADLGYYYLNGERWYAEPTAEDLDRPRTFSLLLGLVAQGNVEYVFMAREVQALLVEYARSIGTDEAFLSALFSEADGEKEALVRHRWGHHTHLHVRFYSDDACEAGERAFDALRKNRKI